MATSRNHAPPAVDDLPPLRDDRLYTAEEAAPYVRRKPQWLKRQARQDLIQHQYLGRMPAWNAQHIRDIVAGVEHKPRRARRTGAPAQQRRRAAVA